MSNEVKYEHEQVSVTHPYDGNVIHVDEGMADVLKLLWSRGYDTINSCQNNNGKIWIAFEQDDFNALVQRAHDTYKSATRYTPNLGEFLFDSCSRTIHWQDDGYIDETDHHVPGDTIMFGVSIRFAPERLDEFIELFKRLYNGYKFP